MAAAPNRRAPGLLLAWFLLDAAMGVYLWLNGPSTPSRFLLAGGQMLLLYVLLRRPSRDAFLPTIDQLGLGLGVLLAIELAARAAIPFRPEAPTPTVPVPALAVIALVALAAWFIVRVVTPGRRPRIVAAAIAVIVGAGLAARWVIVAWDVEPGFDVHLIQIAAGKALLAGQNPYLTHIYVSGYPYWPLSAILAAAGLLFGDARWGLLVADGTIVAALAVIARNVGAPARIGALAGAVLLWDSSGLYMTWQSLPEAAVIAFGTLGVVALTSRRARRPAGRIAAGIALGFAVATKQLGLGLLPFLPLSRDRARWTAFAVASAVSGVIVLAFLALAPAQFIEGSVASHLVEPARDYAVNLLDPLPGIVPRFTVPFAVTAIVAGGIGLAVRLRWPDSIDGWLAASTALLTVAFTLIGISFVNYYQIPLALLLILVLVPDGWNPEPGAPRAA
jgi:hypothetical protein